MRDSRSTSTSGTGTSSGRRLLRRAFTVGAPLALGAATVVLGSTASGDVHEVFEDGDAGQLAADAQQVDATGKITGTLAANGDVDAYRLCVGDTGLSVSTVGLTGIDTLLHVFGTDGAAIARNDDAGSMQSTIVLDSIPAGEYVVAVSSWSRDAVNGAGEMLFTGASNQTGPKALADLVLADWTGPGSQSGAYSISVAGAASCDAVPEVGELDATVDVKPGSDENPIVMKKRGRTPVAMLGSDALDASTVDTGSIAAGPGQAPAAHTALEDVNADGTVDLVMHFETDALGLTADDTELCVDATTVDGDAIHGCDAVSVK